MNENHAKLMPSPEWAAHIQDEVLPQATAGVELGADLLELGPGPGAVPGAGWGNAVDIAVWYVMPPSIFCMIWWMWPFSTVTEPNRLR